MKSEILLNHDIPSLDEILFGKKEEKKYEQERIELDDEIPELVPRTPLPRFRKVTLDELMSALGKAIKTENRRITREIVVKQQEKEVQLTMPKNTVNLKDKIREIYRKIKEAFSDRDTGLAFSELLKMTGENKIYAFVSLLHLDNQQKVWLEQEGHFEEIWIFLKSLYVEKNKEAFAGPRLFLRYAADRHITVVPEIDAPGHVQAAIAAYPELGVPGSSTERYFGTEVGFSSLDVHSALTYRFLDDVFGELAALTPGPFLHVGGDEAHSTTRDDYLAFMARVQPLVAKRGKRLVGWEEVASAELADGAVVQYWKDPALARAAAEQGAQLIASPADRVYLDMKYDADTPLGLDWAGHVELRDSYDWDPATLVSGVGEEASHGRAGGAATATGRRVPPALSG
jgi:hypothetical protein